MSYKNKIRDNKGFTLAELLIVVAIIAVLVAVAVPVFTTQLEKSREATDIANLRSAYAQAVADVLTSTDSTTGESKTFTYNYAGKASQEGFQNEELKQTKSTLGFKTDYEGKAEGSSSITVTYTPSTSTGGGTTSDTSSQFDVNFGSGSSSSTDTTTNNPEP